MVKINFNKVSYVFDLNNFSNENIKDFKTGSILISLILNKKVTKGTSQKYDIKPIDIKNDLILTLDTGFKLPQGGKRSIEAVDQHSIADQRQDIRQRGDRLLTLVNDLALNAGKPHSHDSVGIVTDDPAAHYSFPRIMIATSRPKIEIPSPSATKISAFAKDFGSSASAPIAAGAAWPTAMPLPIQPTPTEIAAAR